MRGVTVVTFCGFCNRRHEISQQLNVNGKVSFYAYIQYLYMVKFRLNTIGTGVAP